MSFPATPLGLTVELLLGGAWTSITSLVRGKDDLVVKRGRSDEATQVDRSTCTFTANNRDGNLSPRNPVGAYYGLIGRNTRMRARLTPASAGYALLPTSTSALSTPDSAGLSITGDIDIRVDLDLAALPPSGIGYELAGKDTSAGNQRSWLLYVSASGTLTFNWTTDGSTIVAAVSTAPITAGRVAVRVTLDVNNGAGGKTVTFYTSDTIAGTWTQLGSAVTTAGTTSIFDSTSPVRVGDSANFANLTAPAASRVYAFQLYSGIAGTLRADVRLDDEEAGATSFVDGQGNTWTLVGDASIVDPSVRFHGEISEWPQRWDTTGRDVWTSLEASGILRHLTQGVSPLKSTLYRGYTSLANPPKAYWPCEDASGSTTLASALPGGRPMTISGDPSLAASTVFPCSEALPTMNAGQWIGLVPTYTATGELQVWILISIPDTGSTDNQSLFTVYTTGTAKQWSVRYRAAPGSGLELRAFDGSGTQLDTSGPIDFNIDGHPERISMALTQNGPDVDWELLGQTLTPSVGGLGGTFAGMTFGRATKIIINPGADDLGDIAFGHVSIHDEIRDPNDLVTEFIAYAGETAGRRVQRLCSEEGVAFRPVGNMDATAAMGAQLPAELVSLLQECADADGGILYEPRDMFGLAYRARESLYNQAATLELDYAAAHLSGIEPVDDDQSTRNDITVTRTGGSSVRAVQETGPLSIEAPPDGVGRYDQAVTLNLQSDGQLEDAAGWLLHLGTVDEARYPILSVDLARAPFVISQALTLAAQDLDVGGRLTVDNPPAWLPPDLITQLAQGFQERMSNFAHSIDVNCSPEIPWGQVAVYDDGASRYESDGTFLAEDLTITETDVTVNIPAGPVWSHADGDFDIRIGGEVMRVTAVSGTATPQTFTVTRSVNGVVKAHLTGAEVTLNDRRVYAR